MSLEHFYRSYNAEKWDDALEQLKQLKPFIADMLGNRNIMQPDVFKNAIVAIVDQSVKEETKIDPESIFISLGFNTDVAWFLGAIARKNCKAIVTHARSLPTWKKILEKNKTIAGIFVKYYYAYMMGFCDFETFRAVKSNLPELKPGWDGFMNSLTNQDHSVFVWFVTTGGYPDVLVKTNDQHVALVEKMKMIANRCTVAVRVKINNAIQNALRKGLTT